MNEARRSRVLDVRSGERHHCYKAIWTKDWYYNMPIGVQLVFQYLWDYADSGGFVNPDRISDFNYTRIKEPKKFLTEDYVLEWFNKHRDVIRVTETGYWYFEDYFKVQADRVKLDCSKGLDRKKKGDDRNTTGGQVKGLVRSFIRHGVNPSTIRGLRIFIPPKDDDLFHSEEGYNQALMEDSFDDE